MFHALRHCVLEIEQPSFIQFSNTKIYFYRHCQLEFSNARLKVRRTTESLSISLSIEDYVRSHVYFHALASSLASNLSTMVRLSLSARQTAISMFTARYKVGAIQKRLEEEDVCITTRSLYRLIKNSRTPGDS